LEETERRQPRRKSAMMSMFGEKRRKKSRNDERGGVRENRQMDAESSGEPKGMEHQAAMQHSKDKRVALFPFHYTKLLPCWGLCEWGIKDTRYHPHAWLSI
jgi:hypothetical protein